MQWLIIYNDGNGYKAREVYGEDIQQVTYNLPDDIALYWITSISRI